MSVIQITPEILARIHAHGESAYPEEGAGFLLGSGGALLKQVVDILPLPNAREESARHDRYLISAQDYVRGESTADRLGLSLIGVFHSHPDHPNQPSEYDRDWAQPFFSYIITNVQAGKATESRSWLLSEDRTRFDEEEIRITGVSQ
jgi:proteasome lid subunit RPN8/RPN11